MADTIMNIAMEKVLVTDPYYRNALEKENDYLRLLSTDRLLAGFRETAARGAGMGEEETREYMRGAQRYPGGWENGLIGGHTLGHWMAAAAQACVNPGTSPEDQKEIAGKLSEVVEALADCQEKVKDTPYAGYIFGAVLVDNENVAAQFDNVEQGKTDIMTQSWVPWYTMHKLVAGLLSAYSLAGLERAYQVVKALGDWIADRALGWDKEMVRRALAVEYGGMNDCLYDLYQAVKHREGEEQAARYREAAHQFDEVELFELVQSGVKNVLNNRHANTTIPKYLGALKRYMVLKDEPYLHYAETFWELVKEKHSYITGGNSEWEHFGADSILDGERTNCNCETCNTYNMLKLSRELFKLTGNPKYTDFYENTFINAIMSSQNPETGMSMYFQPMATGYHKVFGTPEGNFWCCTGSGMENYTKLNDSIYYGSADYLIVALYLASSVEFGQGNLRLIQSGDLSVSERMALQVESLGEGEITAGLKLRLPDWLAGKAAITVNGQPYSYAEENGYAVIPSQELSDGTEIAVTLPMEIRVHQLPDGKHTCAFQYGPYVLSAKLGTARQKQGTTGVQVSISTKRAVDNDRIAITSCDSVEEYMDRVNENMVKEEGKLIFHLQGTDQKAAFVPHYSQYRESYGIYWTFAAGAAAGEGDGALREQERLDRAMLEGIRPGYGQDETGYREFGQGTDSQSSPNWRRARAGGGFCYDMLVARGCDNWLVCTFDKKEEGKTLRILAGEEEIFAGEVRSTASQAMDITLSENDREDYYQMRFVLPGKLVERCAKNTRMAGTEEQNAEGGMGFVTVEFAGTEGRESAKLCIMCYMFREI